MTGQAQIPDALTRKRLVANLRKTRLELQEFGFQLEELIALVEKDIRQQKLQRLQKAKQTLT